MTEFEQCSSPTNTHEHTRSSEPGPNVVRRHLSNKLRRYANSRNDKGDKRQPRDISDAFRALQHAVLEPDKESSEHSHDMQSQNPRLEGRLSDACCKTQMVPNLLEQDRYHRPVENKNIRHYKSRYDYIVQKFLQPWASENDLIFDDRALSNLDSVLCPLIQNSKECGTLRSQVQVLQQELLKRDEKTIAISDEQFAQEFRNLTGLIKTVSRSMRPFEAMNIVRILGPCILTNGMAPLHHDDRVGKKLYIESCIWSTLIQMVFRTPFAVFGSEGNTVSDLWFNMYNMQHHHGWPHPSLPCETWRRTTMEQFMTMVNMAIVAQGERRTHHSYLEQCVVQAHANVVSSMSAHLSLIAPKVASSHLCRIVSEAFNLAVRMSLQRSRLQITFPKIGDNFSSSEMRNLSTSADEGGENGIVTLIVNPGLTKWGDAQGKNFEHRYNVVPALVQLHC